MTQDLYTDILIGVAIVLAIWIGINVWLDKD